MRAKEKYKGNIVINFSKKYLKTSMLGDSLPIFNSIQFRMFLNAGVNYVRVEDPSPVPIPLVRQCGFRDGQLPTKATEPPFLPSFVAVDNKFAPPERVWT